MKTSRTILALLILVLLQACGGGEPDIVAAEDPPATIQRPGSCQDRQESCL
jgi:hypothetical protein